MKLHNLVKVFAFSLLLLGVPTIASAQWGNNGGYGNGGYGNGNYNSDALKSAVKRVKSNAKRLEQQMDRNDNGRQRVDIENMTDDFKNAADRLENKFGNGRNLNNSYDEANRVVQLAQQIDRVLGNYRGGRGGYNSNGYTNWNSIRNDVQFIANAYGIRMNNNRGIWNNGRGNGRGNNTRNFPWPF